MAAHDISFAMSAMTCFVSDCRLKGGVTHLIEKDGRFLKFFLLLKVQQTIVGQIIAASFLS